MVSAINAFIQAVLNARRKSILVICIIKQCTKAKILALYTCFNSEKQLTLRGCSKCNKQEGIHKVMILHSIQISLNLAKWWLLQPLRMSSLYPLIVHDFVNALKCFNHAILKSLFVQPLSLTVITQLQGMESSLYHIEMCTLPAQIM